MIRVRVMTYAEYRDWCRDQYAGDRAETARALDEIPMVIWDDGRFQWVCPACGRAAAGQFAPEPVSGWENPRWTREGDDEHLTLMPSLGCPGFRTGGCP